LNYVLLYTNGDCMQINIKIGLKYSTQFVILFDEIHARHYN